MFTADPAEGAHGAPTSPLMGQAKFDYSTEVMVPPPVWNSGFANY